MKDRIELAKYFTKLGFKVGIESGFYYNFNRWHILSYGQPIYFYKPRPGNGCMIATRELVIKAMETRISKCPELSGYYTKELGSSKRMRGYDQIEAKPFYSSEPVLNMSFLLIRPLNPSEIYLAC